MVSVMNAWMFKFLLFVAVMPQRVTLICCLSSQHLYMAGAEPFFSIGLVSCLRPNSCTASSSNGQRD